MAKLVVLSEGFTGLTCELKADKTTVGRLEDNAFQIPEPSVSSHHCELIRRPTDLLVKDLNSTNGTFINGEKVVEAVLKPGQILRLGQVEMRLESGAAAAVAVSPASRIANRLSSVTADSSIQPLADAALIMLYSALTA